MRLGIMSDSIVFSVMKLYRSSAVLKYHKNNNIKTTGYSLLKNSLCGLDRSVKLKDIVSIWHVSDSIT